MALRIYSATSTLAENRPSSSGQKHSYLHSHKPKVVSVLEERGSPPQAVVWVADDTLGLFKSIPTSGGEDFYLLAFLSSYKTPQALESFEKLHFYVQSIMRYPMNSPKTVNRQVELELSMQDLFTKGRFLPRRNFLEQGLFCAGLEQTLCVLFGNCIVQDPLALQKINKPRVNNSTQDFSLEPLVKAESQWTDYRWLEVGPELAQEEREGIQAVSRMLASECRIGFKKEREEVLAADEKVPEQPIKTKDQSDNEAKKTVGPAATLAPPLFDFGPAKETTKERPTAVNAEVEQTIEEEQFFKEMNENLNTDIGFGDEGPGGRQFQFIFEKSKSEEPQNIMVFEALREAEVTIDFSFPDSTNRNRQILQNTLPQHHSTVPFDRTETSSPNRSKRPSFSRKEDEIYGPVEPSTPDSVFAEEHGLPRNYLGTRHYVTKPLFDESPFSSPELPGSRGLFPIPHRGPYQQEGGMSLPMEPPANGTNPFGNDTPQASPPKEGEFIIPEISGPRETPSDDNGEGWENWKDRKTLASITNTASQIGRSHTSQAQPKHQDQFAGWKDVEMRVEEGGREENRQGHQRAEAVAYYTSSEHLGRLPIETPPVEGITVMGVNAQLLIHGQQQMESFAERFPVIFPSIADAYLQISPPVSMSQDEMNFTRPNKMPVIDLVSGLEDTRGTKTVLAHKTQHHLQTLATGDPRSLNPFPQHLAPALVPPQLPRQGSEHIYEPGTVHVKHHPYIFSPVETVSGTSTFDETMQHGAGLPPRGSAFPNNQHAPPRQVERMEERHQKKPLESIDIGMPPEDMKNSSQQTTLNFNFDGQLKQNNPLFVLPNENDFFDKFNNGGFFEPQSKTYEPQSHFSGYRQPQGLPLPGRPNPPSVFEPEPPRPPVPMQVIRSPAADNLDLLGLDITPLPALTPVLANPLPQGLNPFEEDTPSQAYFNSQSPAISHPKSLPSVQQTTVEKMVPTLDAEKISTAENPVPSLNDFELWHRDRILHREALKAGTQTTELIGRLALSTKLPHAAHARVRVALVGDFWQREGLAKRVPPKDSSGIVEDLPSAVEYSCSDVGST